MNRTMAALALMFATMSMSSADIIHVPDYQRGYLTIQSGINAAAHDGDVVAVWGPAPGQPQNPPYVYKEDIHIQDKSVQVVNWSFWPGSQTGNDSTMWSVVIDGSTGSGPVVTISNTPDTSQCTIVDLWGHDTDN